MNRHRKNTSQSFGRVRWQTLPVSFPALPHALHWAFQVTILNVLNHEALVFPQLSYPRLGMTQTSSALFLPARTWLIKSSINCVSLFPIEGTTFHHNWPDFWNRANKLWAWGEGLRECYSPRYWNPSWSQVSGEWSAPSQMARAVHWQLPFHQNRGYFELVAWKRMRAEL